MASYRVKGNQAVIHLDTQKFWDCWQPSQKNGVANKVVEAKMKAMENNEPLDPIVIEKIEEDEGQAVIRTADGRHRLEAAKRLKIPKVPVLDTEIARGAKEIFDL